MRATLGNLYQAETVEKSDPKEFDMKMFSVRARKEWLAPLLLVLLVVIFCTSHLIWISQDQRPFHANDSYAYLSRAVKSVDDFGWHTLQDPQQAIVDLAGVTGRPLLYTVLTVPLIAFFGPSRGPQPLATAGCPSRARGKYTRTASSVLAPSVPRIALASCDGRCWRPGRVPVAVALALAGLGQRPCDGWCSRPEGRSGR